VRSTGSAIRFASYDSWSEVMTVLRSARALLQRCWDGKEGD
jgi:hypothetical protein